MTSHMNGQEEEINQRKAESIGFESNSQSSMSSLSQQHLQENQRNTTEDVKPSISLLKQPSLLKQSLQGKSNQQQQQQEQEQSPAVKEEKSRESSDSDDDSSDSDGEQSNNEMENEPNYPCDLCDLFFKSTTELRQHVKSHIESIGGAPIEESNDDNEYYEGLYLNFVVHNLCLSRDLFKLTKYLFHFFSIYSISDDQDDQDDQEGNEDYDGENDDEMVEEDFEDDEVSKQSCIRTNFYF